MSAKGKKEVTIKPEKGKEKEKDEKVGPNPTKGQLISKCPYEKSVLSKIPTKIFPRFLP